MNHAIAPEDDWPIECDEWRESMAAVLEAHGVDRAVSLLRQLQAQVETAGGRAYAFETPYRNTLDPADEPPYPGDEATEQRLEDMIRWNAMALVLQAVDRGDGVGGHIATYASTATALEVGFNHVFRGRSADYGGDIINVQAHAAPGIYARAFLEGRLEAHHLAHFRRELQPGGGLSSYPHPFRMPWLWPLPTASMGLSTPCSIYLARFAKYLERRGLKPANGGRVWTFIGDGEADEPEVLGTLPIAAREGLDNLIMVVNCNLQRLDGPVRGNGKIIQELERYYRGAGWRVIKVIWGSGWDPVLARDHHGVLQARMNRALDGDYQLYTVLDWRAVRDHWEQGDPELKALMDSLSPLEVRTLRRGGHDRRKLYAAYRRALVSDGRPTVILIKTIKGQGLGKGAEGRNTAHQKKQLSLEERRDCAARFNIPLEPAAVDAAAFYCPPADDPALAYLRARREALGGGLPARRDTCPAVAAPDRGPFADALAGSGGRSQSTTMVLVRLLAKLLRDRRWGPYIVPIVPDEARTFGMDGLFRQAGIYSNEGQRYTPVDASTVMPYKEAADGQILQEGICEAGAMASFVAAGSAYAHFGVPTLPFYIFYSMFGFQRVGDLIWAAADARCRGFLVGGTAGRTTLNGEGFQHQDGHSPLVAHTIPSLVSYDPAFGYELAVIVRDGMRRMAEAQENRFYYLTVYNQSDSMPALPEGVAEADILGGVYRFRAPLATGELDAAPAVRLLGSGAVMGEVLTAQEWLAAEGIAAEVWSVTSYGELLRDALTCERWNRLHPRQPLRIPRVTRAFAGRDNVFIAASDYLKLLPQAIASWLPGPLVALGTDGFGLSETRPVLRAHFEVDAGHIAYAAAVALARRGALDFQRAEALGRRFGVAFERDDPAGWA
ncbi:MAG: pyruvate dehydrogenase (acetyl-transferring), homodimeric type [Candidatus Competibacterales bacterium]